MFRRAWLTLFEQHLSPFSLKVLCSVWASLKLHFSFCLPGLYFCELPEHRLLPAEGGEGDASDHPDRHLQLQQLQQPARPQGLRSDQGVLWQGEEERQPDPHDSVNPWLFLFVLICVCAFAAGCWEEASWWGEETAQEEDKRWVLFIWQKYLICINDIKEFDQKCTQGRWGREAGVTKQT